MKRIVYIDGENFVHTVLNILSTKGLIKSRSEIEDFDFTYLLKEISRARPAKAQHVRYYGAKLRIARQSKALQKQSEDMVRWNARWITNLHKQGIEYIKCGHLKVRDSHKCSHCGKTELIFQEKGVDVGLAVDVVSDAFKTQGGEAIIFSADSDLLPAIKRAHGAGTTVIYAAYSGAVNRALTTMVDELWTYSADQVIAAFTRAKKHGKA